MKGFLLPILVFCAVCLLAGCGGGMNKGFGSGTPTITLSATSVTFPDQIVGTPSAPVVITLTNSSAIAVSIANIVASTNFAETDTCRTTTPATLAAAATCTVSVTFTPTAAGALTGTIAITDNAKGSPQMVTLTGTGS
jgi:hypothetical protein